jgi:ADP-ribose pyrophosphatase
LEILLEKEAVIMKIENLTEETISRSDIYAGRVFTIHVDEVKLPDGTPATREVVEHNGGVAVLALDDSDHVLMVRQYRYGADRVMLELPAGKLEKGEDPAACGLRELREETGMSAGEYSLLAKMYPTPAYCSECISIYLAEDLTPGEQHLDEGEFLSVERIPLSRAVEMCLSGEITDAKTLTGLLKYAYLRQGFAKP